MKKVFYSPGGTDETTGGSGDTKAGTAKTVAPQTEAVKPLKPTLTKPSAKHGKTEDVLVLRPGQVYIVPLDDKGNEQEGAGFVTNQAAATRHYSNPKKFVLKKKAS